VIHHLTAIVHYANRYSCSKDILKAVKDLHPLPNVVLEHRKLTALITKYIDVLPKYIRYNARFEMDRYRSPRLPREVHSCY
jgi:DNA polymerase I-like protein with 3'-5' exonuclease and polymerase domains